MSREIKFRAWQKKMCVMLYDTNRKENEILFDTTLRRTGAHYSQELKIVHDAVLYESAPDMGYYGGGYWDYLFTDECEYMQYTGLKDRNGKEIYEGDIVQIFEKHKSQVVWVEKEARFKMYFDSSAEVIGNIYEEVNTDESESSIQHHTDEQQEEKEADKG